MEIFQLKIFATKVGIQAFVVKYLAMTIGDIIEYFMRPNH